MNTDAVHRIAHTLACNQDKEPPANTRTRTRTRTRTHTRTRTRTQAEVQVRRPKRKKTQIETYSMHRDKRDIGFGEHQIVAARGAHVRVLNSVESSRLPNRTMIGGQAAVGVCLWCVAVEARSRTVC